MSSGVIVGRTGRYKIFPVVGTAVMAVGFVLLSRMGPDTSTLVQSLYLVVLGAGIGMCMQVLVLIVQNTVDFADLGVATSGVTFFRTIGSSFGAAVFGSLFNNFLHSRIGAALAQSGAPPEAAQSPDALHRLSPEMAAPIAAAYADALNLVFLCAAPVAVVGFVVGVDAQTGSAARHRRQHRRRSWRGFRDADDRLAGSTAGERRRPTDSPRFRCAIARPGGTPGQQARHRPTVGAAAGLPVRAGHRTGPDGRRRRSRPGATRDPRAGVRPARCHRLRRAQRRCLLVDPGRGTPGRTRSRGDDGLAHPTARPIFWSAGPSGADWARAGAHHTRRSGATGLGRRRDPGDADACSA